MKQQNSIETSDAPRIVLEQIDGDLIVTGWAQSQFQIVHGEETDIRVEDDMIFVRCSDDCTLQIPIGSSLEVHNVGGDATLHSIQGAAHLHTIGGDLRLDEMGSTQIEQVGGDLVAHQIHGNLHAKTVGGDAKLANVQGDCQVKAGGDLMLTQANGAVQAEAGGDVNLHLTAVMPQNYQLKAGGDFACRLPEDANVTVQAVCGGEVIVKRLPTPARRTQNELILTLGTGEATLLIKAGGDISLIGQSMTSEWSAEEWGSEFGAEFGAEFGERAAQMAQQVVSQVEHQIDHLTRHLDKRLAHLGTSDEIAGRVQERVQNAMRKAEERIAEAMRHTEQRIREAEQRTNPPRPPHAASWRPVTPPPAPKAPTPPNDEERRMILRMVSEGKLSVEQADQLLAALVSPQTE